MKFIIKVVKSPITWIVGALSLIGGVITWALNHK